MTRVESSAGVLLGVPGSDWPVPLASFDARRLTTDSDFEPDESWIRRQEQVLVAAVLRSVPRELHRVDRTSRAGVPPRVLSKVVVYDYQAGRARCETRGHEDIGH